MSRDIGKAGLNLIRHYEGCRLTAYKALPTEPYYTIGWGHYGPDVAAGQTITQAEADAMLTADCRQYAAYVDDAALCPRTAELNENQRDALISFTYNCGPGSLKTLCKNRTLPEIAQALLLYDKAGGKVLAGLQRRRKAEKALFEEPTEQEKRMTQAEFNKLANAWLESRAEQDAILYTPEGRAAREWAELAGILLGDTKGRKQYRSFCTREQTVLFLYRLVKQLGLE